MSMPVCWYRLLWQLGEALFAEVQHLLQKKVTYRYIAAYPVLPYLVRLTSTEIILPQRIGYGSGSTRIFDP